MEIELAAKLESSGMQFQTQVEIPVTTADFYFATDPRPTLVFVDGKPASHNCSDDQGRRVAIPSQEARIQSSRARRNDVYFGHDPVRQLVSNIVSEMKNAEFGRAFSRSRDGWLRMERFTVEYIARIN